MNRLAGFLLGMVVCALSAAPAFAATQTATWTGSEGHWSDPANWSTNPDIPNNNGITYDVIIGPSTGPVMLDLDATIDSLSLTSSDLKVNEAQSFGLFITGPFTWTGGTHGGEGTTTVGGLATLRDAGNTLDGRVLVFNGNSSLTRDLTLLNGATIHNHAQMTLSSQRNLFGYDGLLVNTGRVLTASSSLNVVESIWQQTADGVLNVRGRFRMFNGGSHSGEINIGTTATFPDTAVLQLYSSSASGPVIHTFEPGSIVRGAGTGNKIEINGDSLENSVTAHFNGDMDLPTGTFFVTRGTANVRVTPNTRLGDRVRGLSQATVKLIGATPDTEFQINEVDFSFLSTLQTESVSNLNVGTLSLTQSAGLETADDLNLNADTVFINTSLTFSNSDLTVGQTGTISDGNDITLAESILRVAPGATLTVFGGSEAFPTTIQNAPSPAEGGVRAQGEGEQSGVEVGNPAILLGIALLLAHGSDDINTHFSVNEIRAYFPAEVRIGDRDGVKPAKAKVSKFQNRGTLEVNPGSQATINDYTSDGSAVFDVTGGYVNLGVKLGQELPIAGSSLALDGGEIAFSDAADQQHVPLGGLTGAGIIAPVGLPGQPLLTANVDLFNAGLDLSLMLGDFNGNVTLGPGRSPGKLTVAAGSVTFGSGLTTEIEIAGNEQGVSHDWLEVNGALTLGGTLELSVLDGFENLVQSADTFAVITATQTIAGTFSNVAAGARLNTADGLGSFVVNYGAGSAYDPAVVVLSDFEPASTGPEPAILSSPALHPDATIRFTLTGTPGQDYTIWTSIDLNGWTPLSSFQTGQEGTILVSLPVDSEEPQRFFQAIATAGFELQQNVDLGMGQ